MISISTVNQKGQKTLRWKIGSKIMKFKLKSVIANAIIAQTEIEVENVKNGFKKVKTKLKLWKMWKVTKWKCEN